MFDRVFGLDGYFGQLTYAKEYGLDIWYMECEKTVVGSFTNDNFERTIKI
jgi:hypothetical protein